MKGDLFRLGANPRVLTDLDKYEGVTGEEDADEPFHRIVVEVRRDSGEVVEAWTYALKAPPRARLIGTGDFIADRRLRTPRAQPG